MLGSYSHEHKNANAGKLSHILAYKTEWNGNVLVKVPTFFPSSQTCSVCGYQNKDVKNLAVRRWECPVCHSVHGRDINAAVNILNKGLEIKVSYYAFIYCTEGHSGSVYGTCTGTRKYVMGLQEIIDNTGRIDKQNAQEILQITEGFIEATRKKRHIKS